LQDCTAAPGITWDHHVCNTFLLFIVYIKSITIRLLCQFFSPAMERAAKFVEFF